MGIRLFSVHRDQQIVVASFPDQNIPPIRYANCAVVDRTNWACSATAAPDSERK